MTPLAQAIANDACLPIAKRRFGNLANEIGLFDDLHFFECSAVAETALVLSERLVEDAHPNTERLRFLPAPRTWIEWRNDAVNGGDPGRVGLLLEQNVDCALISKVVTAPDGRWRILKSMCRLPLRGSDHDLNSVFLASAPPQGWSRSKWDVSVDVACQEAVGMLAMINTPRVIGRKQHQPHAGLQRKLAAAHAIPGKYPHMAWTEIRLEVRPPRDASDEGTHETRLTGAKAKHFVRCHLRIRLGMLELVTAHHRGNEALGIKRSRYVATPPKDGVWPKWAKAA